MVVYESRWWSLIYSGFAAICSADTTPPAPLATPSSPPPLLLHQLYQSQSCQSIRARERGIASQSTLPHGSGHIHDSCNEVWILPSLRAVYIENQKAASNTIRWILMKLDDKMHRMMLPYAHSMGSRICPTVEGHLQTNAAITLGQLRTNHTFFTFVRSPAAAFLSGFATTMHRTVHDDKKADWGGKSPPTYTRLACNQSDKYLTAFIDDLLEHRSLGIPGFHVLPQIQKIDLDLRVSPTGARDSIRFDFIGAVERLTEDVATLLGRYLGVADAATRAAALLSEAGVMNRGQRNTDRCNHIIQPSTAELVKLRHVLCTVLSADYACFGEYYGACDADIDQAIIKSRVTGSGPRRDKGTYELPTQIGTARATTKQKPKVMLWHLQKGGGTQVVAWLQHLNVSFSTSAEEQAPIRDLDARSRYFRIGLIREPCDYHASEYLWGRRFGQLRESGLGFMRYALQAQGLGYLYENPNVQAGFKAWLKLTHHQVGPSPSPSCGVLGARLWTQLINKTAAATINRLARPESCVVQGESLHGRWSRVCDPPCPIGDCMFQSSAQLRSICKEEVANFEARPFDCWLRTERLSDDFSECMVKYDPSLSIRIESLMKQDHQDPKNQMATRPSCASMYDNDTAKLVYELDGDVAGIFGYTGCCHPHPGSRMPEPVSARRRVRDSVAIVLTGDVRDCPSRDRLAWQLRNYSLFCSSYAAHHSFLSQLGCQRPMLFLNLSQLPKPPFAKDLFDMQQNMLQWLHLQNIIAQFGRRLLKYQFVLKLRYDLNLNADFESTLGRWNPVTSIVYGKSDWIFGAVPETFVEVFRDIYDMIDPPNRSWGDDSMRRSWKSESYFQSRLKIKGVGKQEPLPFGAVIDRGAYSKVRGDGNIRMFGTNGSILARFQQLIPE